MSKNEEQESGRDRLKPNVLTTNNEVYLHEVNDKSKGRNQGLYTLLVLGNK